MKTKRLGKRQSVPADIRRQAKLLAKDNLRANPTIQAIYWFPHREEVRLVEAEENMLRSDNGQVEPLYFPPVPTEGLKYWSAIAVIRSDEVHMLGLPEGWGSWDDAVPLEGGQ